MDSNNPYCHQAFQGNKTSNVYPGENDWRAIYMNPVMFFNSPFTDQPELKGTLKFICGKQPCETKQKLFKK